MCRSKGNAESLPLRFSSWGHREGRMATVEEQSVVSRQRNITATWLTATLRATNHLAGGEVASLSVENWRDKALSNLYRLKATYTRGTPLPASFIPKVADSAWPAILRRRATMPLLVV